MTEEHNFYFVIGFAPAVLTSSTIYVSCAKCVVFAQGKVSDSRCCLFMNGNSFCFSFSKSRCVHKLCACQYSIFFRNNCVNVDINCNVLFLLTVLVRRRGGRS